MNQIALNEDFVKKYLLGDIDEVTRERLEERLLTDEQFFEDFAALEDRLEDELIDEYVGGEMPEGASAVFENVFLAAPHRVEKLRLVRGLHDYVNAPAPAPAAAETTDEEAPQAAAGPAPRWWQLPAFLGARGPYASLALALALLCTAIGLAVFYTKSRRLEAELAALRQQRPAEQGASDELSRLRARNDELAAELQRANDRLTAELRRAETERGAETTPTPAPQTARETPPAPPQSEPPRVFTLALSLLRSRAGDGQSMPELKLPTNATGLRLLLNLDTVDPGDYKSFRADVTRRDGTPVRSGAVSVSRRGGAEPQAALTLPAARLTAGDYVVRLNARQADGAESLIGVYDFRLIR